MDLQSLVQYKKSKRRERAARMAEEPVSLLDDLDSAEEDTDLLKLKPQRPPRPKKIKPIEERLEVPLYEEDIIEGFSFCSFMTYEDLDVRLEIISTINTTLQIHLYIDDFTFRFRP